MDVRGGVVELWAAEVCASGTTDLAADVLAGVPDLREVPQLQLRTEWPARSFQLAMSCSAGTTLTAGPKAAPCVDVKAAPLVGSGRLSWRLSGLPERRCQVLAGRYGSGDRRAPARSGGHAGVAPELMSKRNSAPICNGGRTENDAARLASGDEQGPRRFRHRALHSCWRGSPARCSYSPRECEKYENTLCATRAVCRP